MRFPWLLRNEGGGYSQAAKSREMGIVIADVFTIRKRSEIMSRVRSKGNRATEIRLLSLLRQAKIKGWRRDSPLFGHPDFFFPKERLAVFVDGCFWHGCPLHGTRPQTNRAFWRRKLARNAARDRLVKQELRASKWRVLRIWQHELSRKSEVRCVARIRRALGRATMAALLR